MGIRDRVIARALSQVGFVEGPKNDTPYGVWYGLNHEPYCAMGISWAFNQEDASELVAASTVKGFAYTPSGAQWFKAQGRWGKSPRLGALPFFDFPNDAVHRISHVGIQVVESSGLPIQTVEFNTVGVDGAGQREGGGVFRRRRSVGIVGYGYPDYDGFDARHGGGPPPFPPFPLPSGHWYGGRSSNSRNHSGFFAHEPGIGVFKRRMIERGWRVTDVSDRMDATFVDHVVRPFQKEKGLLVDGEIGARTWDAAWIVPVSP
jgi:hypothetical protein